MSISISSVKSLPLSLATAVAAAPKNSYHACFFPLEIAADHYDHPSPGCSMMNARYEKSLSDP